MKKIPVLFWLMIFLMGLELTPLSAQDDSWRFAVETVARKVGPAVVSIRTEQVEYYGSPYTGYGDIFDQFFSDFTGPSRFYQQRRQGLGSGVIIDGRGYILTNAHVVRDADKLTVMLPDGRTYPGELKGIDPRSDLAVVKITAPDLPSAALGNADGLKIGQWVVAIGNPFGHLLNDPQPTVTTGVVSALHRALPGEYRQDTDYSDLIQTDAAINPGNSGGPLVNLEGEIVGVNVAIFSTSGGYQGIGFAVPIGYAKAIIDRIIKGQPVEQGWIGVGIQDLNPGLARYFQLPSTDGVLVLKVLPGSPAQQAGLAEGDVILAINEVRMRHSAFLLKYLANTEIGKTLTFHIWRNTREQFVPVIVARRETKTAPQSGEPPEMNKPVHPGKDWRGLQVRDSSSKTDGRSREVVPSGVVVQEVVTESPAEKAGIRPGDLLRAINNRPVKSVKDFSRLTRGLSGNCLVQTQRGFTVIEE